MNKNVITTKNHHSDCNTYHTTVCRKVWGISRKEYIPESEAKERGLRECRYCSDEYETSNGDRSIYNLAKQIGENNAKA